jgi:hypothetical protein
MAHCPVFHSHQGSGGEDSSMLEEEAGAWVMGMSGTAWVMGDG